MSPIDIAFPKGHTADVYRAIADAGELHKSAADIATMLGIAERTVPRALDVLESAGLITREGGAGRVNTIRLTSDSEAKIRQLAQVALRDDGAPGAEYMPLRDVKAATADRVRQLRLRGLNAQTDRLEGV
jgi:DNA-binding MarR family transcriptional regulator